MFGTIILYAHVIGAVVGLISGMLAMLFRKGSGLHGAAGAVFFAAMVGMSVSAIYASIFVHPIAINIVVGTLTLYLVVTGWWAAKRHDGRPRPSDSVALAYVIGVALLAFAFGTGVPLPAGVARGVPALAFLIFGIVAALYAASDVAMLRRGGYAGARRIVRHLSRMGISLMIALLSLYPGRPAVFPKAWRATNLLFIPHIVVLGALLLWLVRIRAQRCSQDVQPAPGMAAHAVARS